MNAKSLFQQCPSNPIFAAKAVLNHLNLLARCRGHFDTGVVIGLLREVAELWEAYCRLAKVTPGPQDEFRKTMYVVYPDVMPWFDAARKTGFRFMVAPPQTLHELGTATIESSEEALVSA